ncbi:acyl carrier protein [Streptomyces sp. NPDC001904]|uniref:acyl carrier protein n=1 Tax=Streptomyces sp. NPDC001904 TaxID=3154531 RepID=UPI0033220FF7
MSATTPDVARLAELVARATDDRVTAEEIVGSTEPLAALGVTSLALLRLADSLESEYGILIDLGDRALHTEGLPGLAVHVEELTMRGTR